MFTVVTVTQHLFALYNFKLFFEYFVIFYWFLATSEQNVMFLWAYSYILDIK